MDSFTHGVRLVAGLGMIAAGTTLTAPTALYFVAQLGQHGTGAGSISTQVVPAQATEVTAWPQMVDIPLPPPARGQYPPPEYVPPPVPPQPLPPLPQALSAVGPDLAAGYRPTLQSPPPPLLDGQAPPPLAVGWTARQPDAWAGAGIPQQPQGMVERSSIYIVRDGDDLTGIASRFYGHPSAAEAIWQANRGLLRDPGLLPIGAAIVLPPQAVVARLHSPTNQSVIEPSAAGAPQRPTAAPPVSRPASWLTP